MWAVTSALWSTVVTVDSGSAKLLLTVAAAAKDVPSSVGGPDQFAFYEVSGDIVLTAEGSTLRVPYLLVPRSNSTVSSKVSRLLIWRLMAELATFRRCNASAIEPQRTTSRK